MKINEWKKARTYTSDQLDLAQVVLEEVRGGRRLDRALRSHPLPGGSLIPKHMLVAAYRRLVKEGVWKEDKAFLARIRMKPVRTLSGVTTVTVLTAPYPCPNNCLFCPTEEEMPKSYLRDEPGAARAFQNRFDPFDQVDSRLKEYEAVGHPTEKIELLILGATWSAYPPDYQEDFIKRCYDAMNGRPSASLEEAQQRNETARHRNVGLVIETRPDMITPQEIRRLRRLGVTKVQMGAQSLDDRILALNHRGHTVAQTLQATSLLRAGGFKIVLHWMPNLFGATPESDEQDFARLWDEGFAPDELKIYPTLLLENSDLYGKWKEGAYKPYTTGQLVELISNIKPSIPPYCRVNRVIRDIPSTHVVEGNRRTSLRMDVSAELKRRGQTCRCIRCREVRTRKVLREELTLDDYVYQAACAEEHFLSFVTADDHLAGYLRLSLPGKKAPDLGIEDLAGAALIREVHVYGQSLPVGGEQTGAAQHIGLGTELLERAAAVAREQGYKRLTVIAAVGTRKYYEKRGFRRSDLYMVMDL